MLSERTELTERALKQIGKNDTEEAFRILQEMCRTELVKGKIPTGFRIFAFTLLSGNIILRHDASGTLWAAERTN